MNLRNQKLIAEIKKFKMFRKIVPKFEEARSFSKIMARFGRPRLFSMNVRCDGFFAAILFILLATFASKSVYASEVVEFPEEELARESVVPIFDQPEAVKKRLVTT